MNTRVIIIDDEALARDRIRSFVNTFADNLTVVAEADNGHSGLSVIRQHQPDVVFLDIQMPGMDGFEMLAALAADERPKVIFTTAYDEYAIKAFEVHALDYLLKPFDKDRFLASVQRVQKSDSEVSELQDKLSSLIYDMNKKKVTRLSIKDQGRVYFVPLEKIEWIESAGNYVVVHEHESNHIMRETMTHLESLLPEKMFVRVSRSSIVRLDAVTELSYSAKGELQVILQSGIKIKSSMSPKELHARIDSC